MRLSLYLNWFACDGVSKAYVFLVKLCFILVASQYTFGGIHQVIYTNFLKFRSRKFLDKPFSCSTLHYTTLQHTAWGNLS